MAEDRITIEVRAEGAERAADAVDNVRVATEAAADSMERARSAASDWGNIMSGLNAASDMLGRIANGAQSFAMSALEARANTEAWEHQLAAIMGSAGAAKDELEKLKEMANTTVAIDTEGAIKGSATFQRMGDSADEARSKIESLANATALYGGGAEEIKNALRQIEQLNSRTSGFSQDIIAIQNAIPGVGQMIKEHFNVENFEALSDAGIQGKEVVAAMFEEMSKLEKVDGGIGETMEQIRAAQQDIASGMGEALAPALTLVASCVSGLGKAISELPDWGKGIMAWTVAIGGLVAGLGLAVTTTGQLITSWNALSEVGKTIRDVFMKTTVAKTADTAAEVGNTAATKAGTVARNWDIKAIGKQIAKIWGLVYAKIADLAVGGPKGWAVLAGGVAAAGLAIGGLSYLKSSKEQKSLEDDSKKDADEWMKKHEKKSQAEAPAAAVGNVSNAPKDSTNIQANKDYLKAQNDAAKKREEEAKKRQEEEKKRREEINRANIQKIKNDGEIKYNDLMAAGNVVLAKRAKAEADLNAVLQDATATAAQKTIAQQNYNKTLGDLWASETQKAINKQKSQLDDLLKKRKSFTDKVISEIKRERDAAAGSKYYEQGRMAVLTSGAGFEESESLGGFTPAEAQRAAENVRKKEALEYGQRQSVDAALYGGTTEALQNQTDQINESLQMLREQNQTGQAQVGVLQNILTNLQKLLGYAAVDNRYNMA